MILYNSLFCLVYDFLRAIEMGLRRTDSDQAFASLALISFLEMSNVLFFWPNSLSTEELIGVYVLFLIINLAVFFRNGLYKRVISDDNNRKRYLYFIWGIYSTASIVTFIIETS